MMNKNHKLLGLVLVLLVGLIGLTAFVSADSDLYEITSVEVDGTTVYTDEDGDVAIAGIDLDDTVTVEVELIGTGYDLDFDVFEDACYDLDDHNDDSEDDFCTVDDVRVRVWIGGYEHGDIEEVSDVFDVEPLVTYNKKLTLEIPDDLDVEDDNVYTLYVEVYDDEDEERVSAGVFAERPRHSLDVLDVLYDGSVAAGDALDVEVRVQNLGEKKEEDIRVQVEVAGELDVEYIDELAAFEVDDEDEEDSESVDLLVQLPDDLTEGYYDLTVTIDFDRNHETVEEVYTVWVDGEAADDSSATSEAPEAEDVVVGLSSTSLSGASGEATSFTLTFTNNGEQDETYTVAVSGESQWASSDVSPSVVVVEAGTSEEVMVTVTPDSEASGDYTFSLQVLAEDGELEEEVSMNLSVEDSSSLFGDSSSALKVAFIILIVLIIIVGLVVAFRRLNDEDDDDPLEPKDGKTYY